MIGLVILLIYKNDIKTIHGGRGKGLHSTWLPYIPSEFLYMVLRYVF